MRGGVSPWVVAVSLFGLGEAAPALAADDPIQKAIKKGAKYLKEMHAPHRATTAARTAWKRLAGMALLEARDTRRRPLADEHRQIRSRKRLETDGDL